MKTHQKGLQGLGQGGVLSKGRAGKVPLRGLTSNRECGQSQGGTPAKIWGKSMPGSRNSNCKGAEWEHVGCERETSRRQCGWRRENQRASQRQSLVDHRGGHKHCPSPAPAFSSVNGYKEHHGDFPGGPAVEPSRIWNPPGTGSIPGQGAKIPHASWTNQNINNRSNTVTNSIKSLKMVQKKKKMVKKERKKS